MTVPFPPLAGIPFPLPFNGTEPFIVIIPLMKSYHRMLTRRLLYTAVTRAKEKVIFIGSLAAFFMAVIKPSKNNAL